MSTDGGRNAEEGGAHLTSGDLNAYNRDETESAGRAVGQSVPAVMRLQKKFELSAITVAIERKRFQENHLP